MAKKEYQQTLAKFLSFKLNREVLASENIDDEILLTITPDDIVRFMNLKAYHTETPGEEHHPKYARSGSLYGVKKQLSFFMPRKNISWDNVNKTGNPTRSMQVNEMISRVKKSEVRKQGAESQARRELTFEEFLEVLDIVRHDDTMGELLKYKLGSLLTWQWSMVGRIDDMMRLQFSNFSANNQYPFCGMNRMTWSKNIMEERDTANQIVFGSGDERMCALLNLAVYLEVYSKHNGINDDIAPFGNNFVYGSDDKNGSAHQQVRKTLKDHVWGNNLMLFYFANQYLKI